MRAFIYASGGAKRWARTGPGADIPAEGQHKQLLEVDGVPLIVRMCRQLQGCDVVVVTPHAAIRDVIRAHMPTGAPDVMDVGSPTLLVETIAKSADRWTDGLNIGLMGDCWFSDDAMDRMLASTDMTFFGRPFPSAITLNMARGELFAWTWRMPEYVPTMMRAIHMAIEDCDGRPGERDRAGTPFGGLWQLYRGCVGDPLEQAETLRVTKRFVTFNDFTDDFDTPENFNNWMRQYSRRIIKQPIRDLTGLA